MFQKPALCFYRADLPDLPTGSAGTLSIPEGFYDLPTCLADRVGAFSCEENPSLQQLIPYVVLVNEDDEIFTYSRGAAGGESKLHSKLSIGLGGHIDGLQQAGKLRQWIVQEAKRELEEEVGLTAQVPIVPSAVIIDRLTEKDVDGEKTYVGQVHYGILCIVPCSKADVKKMEAGVIEGAEWKSVKSFTTQDKFRLEPWSGVALDLVAKRIKEDGLKAERSYVEPDENHMALPKGFTPTPNKG